MDTPPSEYSQELFKGITLGKGARFIGYISPKNQTVDKFPKWKIVITDPESGWSGTITNDEPRFSPQSPGLSGIFNVVVTVSGPNCPETTLTPTNYSKANIGVRAHCLGMVGIVSNADGSGGNYWTVYDAKCDAPGAKPSL